MQRGGISPLSLVDCTPGSGVDVDQSIGLSCGVFVRIEPRHRLHDGAPAPRIWLSRAKAPDELSF